jgi:hypothetical protein
MLQFEHPLIIIAAAMILSLLLALFIYHKDSRFKSASKTVKYLLVALRFTSISILILLLFKPKWLNEIKQVEKPILVFLQDASSSILNHEDSSYYKTDFISSLEENTNALASEFDVYSYHFTDSIKEGINPEFKGNYTNISKALKNISDRFHNRNLTGVILASDGNYNQGANPNFSATDLNAPIFTLAIGDTATQKDLSLEAVRHNEIAYFQNEFPIAFDVFSNFNTETEIQVSHKGKTIYSETVSLKNKTPLSKQILIEAKEEGIQYYDINIRTFEGEKNTKNNSHRIAIEVLNNLQNILILSSAPHPDIAALKSALEEGKNYKVTQANFHTFKGELEAYNLIILHQIPTFDNRNQKLLDQIMNSETSTLFIAGNNVNWNKFNSSQNIVSVKSKNSIQEVFPLISQNFTPFKLSENCINFIQTAPPLLAPFGEVTDLAVEHVLFKQKIKGISTNNDLLFFGENEEKHIGVLLAEGLWKWRLFDFQKNDSHDNFNELIQSLSLYLTLNKDKRKLRLQYPKLINQGKTFLLNAQLYNDNYQLIENAELSLALSDNTGNEFIYSLNANGSTYNVAVDHLNKGTYSFKVISEFNDETVEQVGTFAILDAQLEQHKRESDWDILQKMSDNSNGTLIHKENFKSVAEIVSDKINAKPQIYFNQQLSDLIKQKSIFLVLLLCLFFEWAIRKRLGTH